MIYTKYFAGGSKALVVGVGQNTAINLDANDILQVIWGAGERLGITTRAGKRYDLQYIHDSLVKDDIVKIVKFITSLPRDLETASYFKQIEVVDQGVGAVAFVAFDVRDLRSMAAYDNTLTLQFDHALVHTRMREGKLDLEVDDIQKRLHSYAVAGSI